MSSGKRSSYPSRQFYRRVQKDAERELFELNFDDGIPINDIPLSESDQVSVIDVNRPILSRPTSRQSFLGLEQDSSNQSHVLSTSGEEENEFHILPEPAEAQETFNFIEDTLPSGSKLSYSKTQESLESNNKPSWSIETFKSELADWAVKENIAHSKLSTLLQILKKHDDFKVLPVDARSLLHTPRATTVQELCGGNFVYFGVSQGIKQVLKHESVLPKNIELLIGIDGLPISKSSGSQIWPQLGKIRSLPHAPVFVIGIFHGCNKPTNSNDFLSSLVDELKYLVETGIELNNENINLTHVAFVCDAPAKSFILQTKGHTGYFSCSRCEDEGTYAKGRICFSTKCGTKRTHDNFLNKFQDEYHVGESILVNIPGFNLVSDLPLDYMHLVCLGVVKKMINLWLKGGLQYRLSANQVSETSLVLKSFRKFITTDFARKPRGLDEFGRWKATELRFFLLYSGPVVLARQRHFRKEIMDNFLCLSTAMMLLLNPATCYDFQDYAKSLLECFVINFKKLYGSHLISHNVHGLLHLADDVSTFGALDICSAFPFENFMQTLKSLMRKHHHPLQQIYNRLQEQSISSVATVSNHLNEASYKNIHKTGPLTNDCIDPQYKTLQTPKFKITCNGKDSFCLMSDETIVKAKNFAFCSSQKKRVVICEEYERVQDLFKKPFKSSKLNISLIKKKNNQLQVRSVSSIQKKMLLLPFKKDLWAAFPLIHM